MNHIRLIDYIIHLSIIGQNPFISNLDNVKSKKFNKVHFKQKKNNYKKK